MLCSLLPSLSFLFAIVHARGGRGGGGGGGGGGGTTTTQYTVEECYTYALGAVYMLGNDTGLPQDCPKFDGSNYCYWVWNDQHDNDTRNYLTEYSPDRPTTSWEMEIYDAYYNGSFSLTLTPPPANSTLDCPELKSQEINDMFLRVGPQSRGNVSRETYGDNNTYYFQFGRTIFDRDCPQTPNKAFLNFESSIDFLQKPQIWTLESKKNGDKFELDGSLTSTLASYNNYWNYVVNTTGTDSDYPVSGCPTSFSLRSLLADTNAKMNATITATNAELSFSFLDPVHEWTISGSFSGKHWDAGAKILFDKDTITTEGQAEHVKPRPPKDKRLWMDKYGKYVFIAVGVVVLIGILYVLWHCAAALFGCLKCCFSCCSREKRMDRAHDKVMKERAKLREQPLSAEEMTYAAPKGPKGPTETVTQVMPHDPRDSNVNYAVSPTVMQSYYVRAGKYLVELANSQIELHNAHKDLQQAGKRGDEDAVGFAQAMVQHHSAVIEHFMALRAAGM